MRTVLSLPADPAVRYVLRIADTCLILAQRLSEWCGHAPVLEEDIALTNMGLDLLGQARGLYTLAGTLNARAGGEAFDEDRWAYWRDERAFLNLTLVELPNTADAAAHVRSRPGDFGWTVLRNVAVATWLKALWTRLLDSSEPELAAIAAKAVKEARYHQQHNGDWVIRLGDGTEASRQRMQQAVQRLWPYTAECFVEDAVDAAAQAQGLGPGMAALQTEWAAEMASLLAAATLDAPAATPFRSTGRDGVHSEHMGYLLSEMQGLQRAHPEAVW